MKKLLIPMLLIIVALSALVITDTQESEVKESPIGIYTNVEVRHNDELIYSGSNVLTNVGANLTIDYISRTLNLAAVDFIAVGNGTIPTAGDTSLNSEITQTDGLQRAQGDMLSNLGNVSISNEFTYTGLSCVVNTTGLFNHTSANTGFFAADEFTDRTLVTNDKLNITWWYWAT